MAGTSKQKNAENKPKPAPKMRVNESEIPEQGTPNRATEPRAADKPAKGEEAARQKLREEYRHGGIPIGSDPRE